MLYVITDTHLGHKGMINSCGRPENFSSLIMRNWKAKVTNNDTVIHLGDVAWYDEALERLIKLPGKKILVRGNHDKKTNAEYMELGFDFSCDELTMDFDGMQVLFSHEPHYGHSADINIHGHQHDLHRDDYSRLYLPLALEAMGYRPIAVNKEFLHVLHSWVNKKHIPTIEEIMALRQNYLGEPLQRDLYGWYDDGSEAAWLARVERHKVFDEIIAGYNQRPVRLDNREIRRLREKFVRGIIDREAVLEAVFSLG